jgi:hypothetical protein
MASPTVCDYLKYANLQMAAEAFLKDELTGEERYSGGNLITALKAGNNRSLLFTDTQATAFADQWEVLDQKANTGTGFSGTLFKAIKDNAALGIKKDDLVVSFRSTEFIDDFARDNKGTNELELAEGGFALGQIADMEAWYSELATVAEWPSLPAKPTPSPATAWAGIWPPSSTSCARPRYNKGRHGRISPTSSLSTAPASARSATAA